MGRVECEGPAPETKNTEEDGEKSDRERERGTCHEVNGGMTNSVSVRGRSRKGLTTKSPLDMVTRGIGLTSSVTKETTRNRPAGVKEQRGRFQGY